jgi:hypothetical protein
MTTAAVDKLIKEPQSKTEAGVVVFDFFVFQASKKEELGDRECAVRCPCRRRFSYTVLIIMMMDRSGLLRSCTPA